MAKITVALGLSVQLSEGSMEFAKPYIEIKDIDVDGDIKQQISQAITASLQVWDSEVDFLSAKLVEFTNNERPNLVAEVKQAINNAVKAV